MGAISRHLARRLQEKKQLIPRYTAWMVCNRAKRRQTRRFAFSSLASFEKRTWTAFEANAGCLEVKLNAGLRYESWNRNGRPDRPLGLKSMVFEQFIHISLSARKYSACLKFFWRCCKTASGTRFCLCCSETGLG
jgi:hypothetical protein